MLNMLYINDMDEKTFKLFRILVGAFLAALVFLALLRAQYALAALTALAGLAFLTVVRSGSGVIVDERDRSIREKAAQLTYAIFAPTLGLSALGLLVLSHHSNFFLESLGVILAYLTLFQIALYTLSSFFIDRKLGGHGKEE
ncbi:MAG: hypothetical protein PWQ55_1184 [Chloroflexota bacterium]|nr:hypothetical protein [Chloroflexota bacterium]